MRNLLTISLICVCSGCFAGPIPAPPRPIIEHSLEVQENPVPGTVSNLWVEPIVDTPRIPAGIDPTNTYYMPSHKTVVEIRPGRYQQVQYENEKLAPVPFLPPPSGGMAK